MVNVFTREERAQRSKELGIIVDEQDEWLLNEYTWNWNVPKNAYIITTVKRQRAFLHHAIMGMPIYADTVIDHINRNALDNRRSNLRYATLSTNKINSSLVDASVNIYEREDGTFYVKIARDLRVHYRGTYRTYEEAKRVRDQLHNELTKQGECNAT